MQGNNKERFGDAEWDKMSYFQSVVRHWGLPRNKQVAERVGFEPTLRLPVNRISSAAHSTTLPPLRRSAMTQGAGPWPVGKARRLADALALAKPW